MNKYGAFDVGSKDITRISVQTSLIIYNMGHQIHWVKEDFPGAEFVKQEDIGYRNVCTYKMLCQNQLIFSANYVGRLVMKKMIVELMIFSKK